MTEPDALSDLLASLEAMDKREKLVKDYEVTGAYRLGTDERAPYGLTFKDGSEVILGDADKVLNQPRKCKAAIVGEPLSIPLAPSERVGRADGGSGQIPQAEGADEAPRWARRHGAQAAA